MTRLSARLVGAILGLLIAAEAAGETARIAIIIDDMGSSRAEGKRVVALPGPVGLAFLPGAPHTAELARLAYQSGKDVLLHQPMQPVSRASASARGIGLDSSRAELERRLERNLEAVPHAQGVNNHQGSLITRHPGHMTWLMRALDEHGDLFFIDSRTTHRTVAERMARETGVPVTHREVFLDHDRDPSAIRAELDRLVRIARRRGHAVAIGHPYPQTLAVLEKRLPRLEHRGIALVTIKKLVREVNKEAQASWHVSSSP